MTVRRIKGNWFVDFRFQHADGLTERVRKRAPVPSKAGAQEYERQNRRTEVLSPHHQKKKGGADVRGVRGGHLVADVSDGRW